MPEVETLLTRVAQEAPLPEDRWLWQLPSRSPSNSRASAADGSLAQSMGIGLPEEERDRLQETLERIDELERLADTKAGLVQLH